MNRNRPMTQNYELYTREDLRVWRTLFERQEQLLLLHGSTTYLNAIDKVGFNADAIPNFTEVNTLLQPLTGWQLTVVPGLVEPKDFFGLLADKIFPATCWLRTWAELDYIEEPDMFHDVFGHVPLLADANYARFMQAFGAMALQWIDDEDMINLLSRLYWFTVEFGMIKEHNEVKIYGAGIISSPGEAMHSVAANTERSLFNVTEILTIPYRTDVMQDRYFVIDCFSQLYNALPEVAGIINNFKEQTISLQKPLVS